MSMVAGIVAPSSGRIVIDGIPVEAGRVPDGVAFLTQDRPLYRSFTVDEMIRATGALNTHWDADHARELIDAAGIDRSARIGSLSGGQHSRVAIALAVARRPSVLLLDEPMSDLDPVARREIRDLLRAQAHDHGTTMVISSHIVTELADHCDHLLLLHKGRQVVFGSFDELVPGMGSGADRAAVLEEFIVERLTEGAQT